MKKSVFLLLTSSVLIFTLMSQPQVAFAKELRPFSTPSSQVQLSKNARIQGLAERLATLFQHHHTQLQHLIELGRRRITYLNKKGRNTEALTTQLDQAQKDLDAANSIDDLAVNQVKTLAAADTPQSALSDAKIAVLKAQLAYIQVVQDLKHLVASFKTLR